MKHWFNRKPFWLVLENIRSAYNVGAMFRTADGTGIFGIVLIGFSPTPDNLKVQKTALGAQDAVPWVYFKNSHEFVDKIYNSYNLILWSLELTSKSIDIFSYPFNLENPPIFIVVGNEIDGVSDLLLKKSNLHIKIPQNGIKKSLNVAESASICMYEFYRKFRDRNDIRPNN